MFQKLPVKFCAGATLITGFNDSCHRNSAIFFYGLFVRNSGANKDFTHRF
ncbi:hypothetical protein [Escherichia coli]